jgi:hypothetical protein
VTRPLNVRWTLNLGVDLQVPVVQAPIAVMFNTKCDRYGFMSSSENSSEKLKTPITSRTFQRVGTVKERKRRVALETLRSQKWLEMMRSSLLEHTKLSSRAWKGVSIECVVKKKKRNHSLHTVTQQQQQTNTGARRVEKYSLAYSCRCSLTQQ